MVNINEIINKLLEKFRSEEAEGVNLLYCLRSGEQQYFLQIKDSKFELLEQTAREPDVTLKADQEIWQELIEGETNPQMAFMTGRLGVEGDISSALKLANLFNLG